MCVALITPTAAHHAIQGKSNPTKEKVDLCIKKKIHIKIEGEVSDTIRRLGYLTKLIQFIVNIPHLS